MPVRLSSLADYPNSTRVPRTPNIEPGPRRSHPGRARVADEVQESYAGVPAEQQLAHQPKPSSMSIAALGSSPRAVASQVEQGKREGLGVARAVCRVKTFRTQSLCHELIARELMDPAEEGQAVGDFSGVVGGAGGRQRPSSSARAAAGSCWCTATLRWRSAIASSRGVAFARATATLSSSRSRAAIIISPSCIAVTPAQLRATDRAAECAIGRPVR